MKHLPETEDQRKLLFEYYFYHKNQGSKTKNVTKNPTGIVHIKFTTISITLAQVHYFCQGEGSIKYSG